MSRPCFLFLGWFLLSCIWSRPAFPADGLSQVKVGLQPDGSIVVPTNQVLTPAGQQITFPGRPVDLALADNGRTLIIKNMVNLLFLDVATGRIQQVLPLPTAPPLADFNPKASHGPTH